MYNIINATNERTEATMQFFCSCWVQNNDCEDKGIETFFSNALCAVVRMTDEDNDAIFLNIVILVLNKRIQNRNEARCAQIRCRFISRSLSSAHKLGESER